jgi:hypothetical protein
LFFQGLVDHLGVTRPAPRAQARTEIPEELVMRGTTVLAAALLLAAAPLGAQEYEWSEDRPDGVAPAGISADRTLPTGTLEVGYRFGRNNARGLKFGTASVLETEILELGFTFVPLERTTDAHRVVVGFGITDELTVVGSAAWIQKNRTTANDSVIFFNESSGVSDVTADALWEFYHEGPYRGHVQAGVVVPTGSFDKRGDFGPDVQAILPYEMQIGSGSFAVTPGITGQVQNDRASVGMQVRGIFYLNENDRGWRPGTAVDARLWTAHAFNDVVSVSGGIRAMHRSAIQGADPDLETFRDPGDLALSFANERVDLPLGLNLRLPGTGPLAGKRLSFEAIWTVHEQSDGPVLGDDWGFLVGFQSGFALPSLDMGF